MKPVYLLYSPKEELESYLGIAVDTKVINDHFYFLLMMPDSSFKEARAVDCKVVNHTNNESKWM